MVTLYGGVSDGGGEPSRGYVGGGGGLYDLGYGLGNLIGGIIGSGGSGDPTRGYYGPPVVTNPPPGSNTPVVPIVDPGYQPPSNNYSSEVNNTSYSLPSTGNLSGVGTPAMSPLNPLSLGFINPTNLYAPLAGPSRGAKVGSVPINTNPTVSLGGGGGGGDSQGAMVSPSRTPIPQGSNGQAGPEGGFTPPIDRTPINLFGGAERSMPRPPAQPSMRPMPMGGGPVPMGMPIPPPMPRPPAPPAPGTASVTPNARYPGKRMKRPEDVQLEEQKPEADMPPVAPPRPAALDTEESPTAEPTPSEETPPEKPARKSNRIHRQIPGTDYPEAQERPEQPVKFPGRTMPPARGVNNPVYDRDYTQGMPEADAIMKNRRDEIRYLQGWLKNNPEPAKELSDSTARYEKMLQYNMQNRPQGLTNLFHYKFHTGTPRNMRDAAARTPRAMAAAWAKSHADSAPFKAAQEQWTHNRDRVESLIKEDREDTIKRANDIRTAQERQADDQTRQQQKLRDDYTDMLAKMPPGPRKDAMIQKLGDAGIFRPDELDLIANNYDAETAEERQLDIAQKRANLAAMPAKQEAAQVRMQLNQQRLNNNAEMNKVNYQLKQLQLKINSAKFAMMPAKEQLKLANQQADLQKKLYDISMQDLKTQKSLMDLEKGAAYVDSVYSNPMNDVAAAAGRGLTGDAKTEAINAKRADIAGRTKRVGDLVNNRPTQNPNQFRDYYNKARELMDSGKSREEVQKLLGTRANLNQLEAAYGRL